MIVNGTRRLIPVREVYILDAHWTREIDEAELDSLIDNLEEIGQINPITVRRIGKSGHAYELLAGMRRLLAMKKAGGKNIEAKVVKLDDDAARLLSLSENAHTAKPKPSEFADIVKEMADLKEKVLTREQRRMRARASEYKKSKDIKEKEIISGNLPKNNPPKSGRGRPKSIKREALRQVAKDVGISERDAARQIQRSGDLTAFAKKMLDEGRITGAQADELCKMPKNRQKRRVLEMTRETREARERKQLKKLAGHTRGVSRECDNILQGTNGHRRDLIPALEAAGLKTEVLEQCQRRLGELLSLFPPGPEDD